MIFRLEIENFFSILDPQVLDIRVTDKVPEEPHRFGLVHPGSTERVPKVVALFGANAAGKTTVLRALAFLTWFAKDSFQLPPEAGLPFQYFESEEGRARPTRLAISFGGPAILAPGDDSPKTFGTYNYELILAHRHPQPSMVKRESLTFRSSEARKPSRVFERDEEGRVVGSKTFSVSGLGPIADKIRWNASAVATLAQFEHAEALALRNAARTIQTNVLLIKADPSDAQVVEAYSVLPNLLEALNAEIKRIDVGTEKMQVHHDPRGRQLYFFHGGLGAPIPWLLESHGTQSFIRSFPFIWRALEDGGVAIMDELDASIHPLVLIELVRWFHDLRRNPKDAQLWLTAQNASLLEELTKEEIVFCEKNHAGRTSVYGLQSIKNVRRVDNYYRKYLSGAYGAVPNIG